MYKVLIVDDEKIVRIALKTMIKWEEYGFWIIGSVSDGLEAMSFVEKNDPEVIITDLKMPNMDGIELIKGLNSRGYQGKVIVLSNYDDFEFVKQALKLGAMDYILKITLNQDVLVNMLSVLREQLDKEVITNKPVNTNSGIESINSEHEKSDFFRELFREDSVNEHEQDFIARAKAIGLPINMQESIMLYVFIEDYDRCFGNLNYEEREALNLSISNTLEENLNNFDNIEIVSIDYKRDVIIIPKENLTRHEINEYSLADKIIKSIGLYLNIQINIIITNEVKGYSEARKSYETCIHEENMEFYGQKHKIIKLGENALVVSDINLEIKKVLDSIIKLFEIGSLNEIVNEIDRIFEVSKLRHYHPLEVKKNILMLLEATEKHIWNEFEESKEIINNYNDELIFAENYISFRETIIKYFNEFYELYKLKKGKKYKKEIISIVEYLHSHLSEKLTLEMISDYMNMNKSYLCRMFKKETGESIFNYLTDIRIDRATSILKSRDCTIKELGFEVGMEDQFYFNRVFKKKLGISPTEFRKKYFKEMGELNN